MSFNRRKRAAAGRLVVVLGMHRSGTSAIARGLQVIGVELGERLMPPAPGNNEKGFFEDIEVNALCRELLQTLGRDWDSLEPPAAAEFTDERIAPLRLRAVELLRERLREMPVFGLKDPRISVLLAFWRPIFESVALEVSYVIAARHPLSVARSLEQRDGFAVEKSCYLWLHHVLRAVLDSAGAPRRVVSYDLLLTEPERQLARLGQAFGLPFDARSKAFTDYAHGFLSKELRHSVYDVSDLELNRAVPPEVAGVHRLLERLARDEIGLDQPEPGRYFEAVAGGLDETRPALALASRLDAMASRLDQQAKQAAARLQELEAALAERNGQVRDLTDMVVGKDRDIAELQRGHAIKDGQVHGLNLTVVERDGRLGLLQARCDEGDGRVRDLTGMLAAKDVAAAGLQKALADRDEQVRDLTGILVARDADGAALRQALAGRDALIAARDARVQELGGIVVAKDADIATLQHAVAVKDGQIHGLTLTVAERETRLAGLVSIADQRERDLQVAIDSSRNAFRVASRIFREQLEAEAQLVDKSARLGTATPSSRSSDALARVAQAYAAAIRDLGASLDDGAIDRAQETDLRARLEAVFAARAQVWRDFADLALDLAASVHTAQADSELNRLRLLDSLREATRAREHLAQLESRIVGAESALARVEADLQQRERILGQFGHQFVSRLGRLLDPYPAVRWILTAPLRLLHRLLGGARA